MTHIKNQKEEKYFGYIQYYSLTLFAKNLLLGITYLTFVFVIILSSPDPNRQLDPACKNSPNPTGLTRPRHPLSQLFSPAFQLNNPAKEAYPQR